ncbi:hypothetical protein [Bosea sp. UNC402CLCol]|uniref:hypothetical protein n=1 Tax=Bosea sp. UNC402CLCol TaxID=1510531 RepID=UPI00056E465C|nr:hypothetical protein [Bosea sp. UNC402CLCol]
MIRLFSALAVWFLLAKPVAVQTLDAADPFRVLHAKFITVTTHLGDGRIKDQKGVRFVIQSDWEHSEADRTAFVDLIIADPSKFTSDTVIIKLMSDADMLLLVADFYKSSRDGIVQKLMYFKDTRRHGWERLILDQKAD